MKVSFNDDAVFIDNSCSEITTLINKIKLYECTIRNSAIFIKDSPEVVEYETIIEKRLKDVLFYNIFDLNYF